MHFPSPGADERVAAVSCDENRLIVDLMDGRTISVPLAWFPRLLDATPEQRRNCCITEAGFGIHWSDIDQNLSTRALLRGAPVSRRASAQNSIVSGDWKEKRDSVSTSVRKLYVVTDTADCRYKRASWSPVCVTPQYGEIVEVTKDSDDWMLVRWFGKCGWVEAFNLSELPPPERAKPDYPIVTESIAIAGNFQSSYSAIEYGPNGGRFTRTKSGFRRYF